MRSQAGPRSGSGQEGNVSLRELRDFDRMEGEDGRESGQFLSTLKESLNREMKIKEGSENLLEALNSKKAKQTKEQRQRVEAELNSSNQKIKELKRKISELQRPRLPSTPTRSRMDGLFQSSSGLRSPQSASKSATGSDFDEPTESPTYALAEILQALEIEGLTPDYYVGHANNLVELFKRHPTLKYDLVWSIFGLRMQVMLLSESREVVAAGYRMTRYAISDISSLQKIRALNTDYLVVL
jgi:rapamycin-insensitive companion of mTOR